LSANGDGANDTWVIPGINNYPNNRVTIFNRWGSVVYEASGYDNSSTVFSGLSNKNSSLGSNLADGTYYYVVQLDSNTIRKGYLVIKK
jgi:gliding motility-associated-like protein